jgi:hypothetical protein
MTMEKYVEGLKELLPEHFIDSIKDWSVSDRMYVSLHYIQIKQMEDIKEMLFNTPKRVHEYTSKGNR